MTMRSTVRKEEWVKCLCTLDKVSLSHVRVFFSETAAAAIKREVTSVSSLRSGNPCICNRRQIQLTLHKFPNLTVFGPFEHYAPISFVHFEQNILFCGLGMPCFFPFIAVVE